MLKSRKSWIWIGIWGSAFYFQLNPTDVVRFFLPGFGYINKIFLLEFKNGGEEREGIRVYCIEQFCNFCDSQRCGGFCFPYGPQQCWSSDQERHLPLIIVTWLSWDLCHWDIILLQILPTAVCKGICWSFLPVLAWFSIGNFPIQSYIFLDFLFSVMGLSVHMPLWHYFNYRGFKIMCIYLKC